MTTNSDTAPGATNVLESPTIDPAEVEKFTRIAAEWWDPKGKFRPLHIFNPVRLGFIRDAVVAANGLDPNARRPFEGLRLLDIGCGGGLLSEPMARLGASVIGVDASPENVKTAMAHAEPLGLDIDYRAGAAEQLLAAGEEPIEGASRDDLVAGLIAHGHRHARALHDEDDLVRLVREQARPGDMVVCLGAGTISAWANALPDRLESKDG